MNIKKASEQVANTRKDILALMVKYKDRSGLTAQGIASKTGLTTHRVRGHLDHSQFKCPSLEDVIAYRPLYGEVFINEVLALMNMGHARSLSPIIMCPFEFHAQSARWTSEQAFALADRVLDHQEKAHLAPIAFERAEANWKFGQFLTGAAH